MKRRDKGFRGDASQFFVAGELCRWGLVATVTMGNCPNTDILCSNPEGTRFAHIQVKTFRPGISTCSVGMKSERDYGTNFFWVLGGIPYPETDESFQYYIIPSQVMAENMRECFRLWVETPGKNGRPHHSFGKSFPDNRKFYLSVSKTSVIPMISAVHKWIYVLSVSFTE